MGEEEKEVRNDNAALAGDSPPIADPPINPDDLPPAELPPNKQAEITTPAPEKDDPKASFKDDRPEAEIMSDIQAKDPRGNTITFANKEKRDIYLAGIQQEQDRLSGPQTRAAIRR